MLFVFVSALNHQQSQLRHALCFPSCSAPFLLHSLSTSMPQGSREYQKHRSQVFDLLLSPDFTSQLDSAKEKWGAAFGEAALVSTTLAWWVAFVAQDAGSFSLSPLLLVWLGLFWFVLGCFRTTHVSCARFFVHLSSIPNENRSGADASTAGLDAQRDRAAALFQWLDKHRGKFTAAWCVCVSE